MSLTATVLIPTAVKANNCSPTVISEFKRGTAFLTMAETLASIVVVFSHTKVALGSTSDGRENFLLGTESAGITAAVPRHLQLPLQGHGLNPHSHTSGRGQPFKQAESLIYLFPLVA